MNLNGFRKKMLLSALIASTCFGSGHSNVRSSYDPKEKELRKRAEKYGSVGNSLMVIYQNTKWLKKGLSGKDDELRDEIEFRLRIIPQSVYGELSQEFKDIVDESGSLIGEDVVGKGIPHQVVEEFHNIPHNYQHFAVDFMKSIYRNKLEVTVEDLRKAYEENLTKYGSPSAFNYSLAQSRELSDYVIPDKIKK